ncbi:winged helix-turn-helix domain-containing protein [Natronococcus occultus]|uniref:winged helix-turn-helix domain-containing protein n=1 Tax=Natronococcus occultus TaxID=29288 RepID=UPI001FE18B81|nr:winged helix-turn-helix domain-containing protein [Natronococcus occultus]
MHRTCETDEVLRVLANARRREIVSVLEALDDNWITVDELARAVSTTGDEWRGELHHVHLPMLRDLGIVDYDRHGETVRYYRCDLVSSVLEAVDAEVPTTQ